MRNANQPCDVVGREGMNAGRVAAVMLTVAVEETRRMFGDNASFHAGAILERHVDVRDERPVRISLDRDIAWNGRGNSSSSGRDFGSNHDGLFDSILSGATAGKCKTLLAPSVVAYQYGWNELVSLFVSNSIRCSDADGDGGSTVGIRTNRPTFGLYMHRSIES